MLNFVLFEFYVKCATGINCISDILDKLFRNPDDLFIFSTKACETRELWFEGLGLPKKGLIGF